MDLHPTLRTKEELLHMVRKRSFLDLHGSHESHLGYTGLSFEEAIPYSGSDDIRHINWKMTARTQTPMLNRFSEEREIPVVLVYLNSGSLYFGEPKSKHHTAVETLTLLSYTASNSKDGFATLFYDDRSAKWYRASRLKKMAARNYDHALSLKPIGASSDIQIAMIELSSRIKRSSVVFLIGDFLTFAQNLDFSILSHRHSVYAAIIRDRDEENITLRGKYDIIDPISQKRSTIQIDSKTATRYNKLFANKDNALLRQMDIDHIAHQKIYTDQEPLDQLIKLVRQK